MDNNETNEEELLENTEALTEVDSAVSTNETSEVHDENVVETISIDNTEMENNEEMDKKARKEKTKKVLLISGLGLAGLQLIISIVFMVILGKLTIIPKDYVIMIDILLVLIFAIIAIAQRWVVPGIITKVISLLLCVALTIGCIYLNATYGAFKRTTGVKYKTTTVSVYVLKECSAESIEEIKTETFGIISELDRSNTDEMISEIQTKLNQGLHTTEYSDAQNLAKALYSKEVTAIILNDAYIGIIEAIKEYADFSKDTKKLESFKKSEEIDNDIANIGFNDKDYITIYVSGVDVDGAPTENRNSDVNILMTINRKTKQVFLLNTPRDFYVPTSVSNGIPDKLTHAGCFGIDCSVKTLEMLYGIEIDYYIKLNFTGFKSIIDALGGVDVYSEYEFTSYHGKYHFVVGTNHMNGKQALGFARERYAFPTGDNQRGKNQMAVITGLINKFASSELLKNYKGVINSIADCMVTDMTMEDIGILIDLQLKENISWDIVQFAVGGRGDNLPCYTLKDPNYVMIPDENLVNLAKEYLGKIQNSQVISL